MLSTVGSLGRLAEANQPSTHAIGGKTTETAQGSSLGAKLTASALDRHFSTYSVHILYPSQYCRIHNSSMRAQASVVRSL